MIRLIAIAFVSMALMAPSLAAAETAHELTWEILVPPAPPLHDPFKHLTRDQKLDLHAIIGIKIEKMQGLIDDDSALLKIAQERIDKLTKQGLDVDALIGEYIKLEKEVAERGEAVVGALDGQLVRMPGYVLPLEFSGTEVSEFFLVPYVGACIHVPPPPPNQMVFVRLHDSTISGDLYEPIWITGRMKVEKTNTLLNYFDGQSKVDAGYTIDGLKVEIYEP
ncbi:MAG: DUF3299 domain-containing protein [Hyphomicrobiales bacterium]|nr:DUF3299 domain-containing protein [Hyphomicrobiales bacterium]